MRGWLRSLPGLCILLAMLGDSAVAAASGPVRIGVSLGLTGQYSLPATMQKRGYELWRDEVNGRGGLLGHTVQLVIHDDRSVPAEAARIYEDFVDRKSVDHVIGPYSSELTLAVAPVVERGGFPMLAAGAAADEIWHKGYRHVLGMWNPASRYVQGMLRLAHEAKLPAIAILHADDQFSEEIAEGARKWAPHLKLRVVLDLRFPKGTTNLTSQMGQARAANADVVVVGGHLDDAVNARQAAAQLRWTPRAFFATVGPSLPVWRSRVGALADGAFSTSIWEPHPAVTHRGSHAFAQAFRQRYGVDPSYHAATAYAAGQIIEAATRRAKTLGRDAVRDALFGLDGQSVIGRYAVDHTGMQSKRHEMIVQWQRVRKEIVWPKSVRSADPVFGP